MLLAIKRRKNDNGMPESAMNRSARHRHIEYWYSSRIQN